PTDLLDERDKPLKLSPYSELPSREPVYSTAIYPYFTLDDPLMALMLTSVREHPIRLTSVLQPSAVATYSLVNPMTEAFITPHSFCFPVTNQTQFIAGSDSLISIFDINRPGKDGPIVSLPTIPSKRKKIVGGGVGMKGIVSAMAISPDGTGVLAAGTFTRHIGLYAANGSGDLLGTFPLAGTIADRKVGGRGVTQVLWSPCGRYLYVVERKSKGIMVYDIRVSGQLLGWLSGRKAMTSQRLKVDLVPGREQEPNQLWAGGTDGSIAVWEHPEYCVEGKEPDWSVKLHDDPVSSAVVHPTANVLATASGQKKYPSDYLDKEDGTEFISQSGQQNGQMDNSLKVWALG
ncbi:hypothetical protein KEM55_004167, partial [Ascosphaera atra]